MERLSCSITAEEFFHIRLEPWSTVELRGLDVDLYVCVTLQGKFYLLIEELSQLFRALVPIQLWYKYIMGEDPSSSYFLGATLIIIYSLCKVANLIVSLTLKMSCCFFLSFFFLLEGFFIAFQKSEINFMWRCTSEPFKISFSELIIQVIFCVCVCVWH